jgi:hypothetical protein
VGRQRQMERLGFQTTHTKWKSLWKKRKVNHSAKYEIQMAKLIWHACVIRAFVSEKYDLQKNDKIVLSGIL